MNLSVTVSDNLVRINARHPRQMEMFGVDILAELFGDDHALQRALDVLNAATAGWPLPPANIGLARYLAAEAETREIVNG